MAAAAAAPRSGRRRRWSLFSVPLAAGVCMQQLQHALFVLRSASSRTGSVLVEQPRWLPSKARGSAPCLQAEYYDVHGMTPEKSDNSMKWALKVEVPHLAGQKLWAKMKANDEIPKKIYIIAATGRQGPEIADSLGQCLAYIQPEDGTMIHQRKPHVPYPPMEYDVYESDKQVAEKSRISAVDLFMDDEPKYRELETEVIREFDAKDSGGKPAIMMLGDSALEQPQNVELVKKGLLLWVDLNVELCWQETQRAGILGSAMGQNIPMPRPPVWAIANGWDGDADDAEGKAEYMEIASELRKSYEKYADIRLNGDLDDIVENSLWGADRLVKAMTAHFNFQEEGEALDGYEEEIMAQDLVKFLESARLSKYGDTAQKWCDEQGASSIEEILENVEDLSEALQLKPLEKKRLLKAAKSVQEALAV